MTLNDQDKLTIVRLQILLTKLKNFKSDNEKWFYLGYIANFIDELTLRSKKTSEANSQ